MAKKSSHTILHSMYIICCTAYSNLFWYLYIDINVYHINKPYKFLWKPYKAKVTAHKTKRNSTQSKDEKMAKKKWFVKSARNIYLAYTYALFMYINICIKYIYCRKMEMWILAWHIDAICINLEIFFHSFLLYFFFATANERAKGNSE